MYLKLENDLLYSTFNLQFHFQAALKAKTYPMVVDEYDPDTYDSVKHRIKQRFTNRKNKLLNVKLSDPNVSTP